MTSTQVNTKKIVAFVFCNDILFLRFLFPYYLFNFEFQKFYLLKTIDAQNVRKYEHKYHSIC